MKSLTDIQREWEEAVRVASKAVTADVNNIVYLVVKPEALAEENKT